MLQIPWWFLLFDILSILAVSVFLGGLLILRYRPKRKIAILWGAVGLIHSFVLIVIIYYPYQAIFGLIPLTSGVILATFDSIKMRRPRKILSMGFFILGFLELLVFLDFYFRFPNFSMWNTQIAVYPFIAFLIAGITTIMCGILILMPKRTVMMIK